MALASAGRLGLAPRGEEPMLRVPVTAAMRFFLALAAGTILACYAIATHLGHVRVFLPVRSRGFPRRRGRCLTDSDGLPPR